MSRKAIIFLLLLLVASLAYGCSKKGNESLTPKETPVPTPTPTPTPTQKTQESVNKTLSDIESQISDLNDLEKSLEVIDNMSFQI